MARPRFSIVIPAYNEAEYLPATLASLHQQTFAGSVEIIVADNNSSDATALIAKSLGARVVKAMTVGVCNARQAGTMAAKGEIIVSTDADTVFHSDWLSRIDAAFRRNPKLVAIGGPCRYFDGPWWGKAYPYLLFGLIALLYRLVGRTFYMTATNIAFKRTVFPGYNIQISQGGDELDLLRNLRQRGRVAFHHRIISYTSARRLERGFIYSFFVTFLWYYILEYNLSRIFNRPVLGNAPAIRIKGGTYTLTPARFVTATALVMGLTLMAANHSVRNHAGHLVQVAASEASEHVHRP